MLFLVPGKQEGCQDHLFVLGKKEKYSWTFRVHPGEGATPKKEKGFPWSKESRAIIIWRDLGDSSESLRNHIVKFISSIRRDRNCLLKKPIYAELSNKHKMRLEEKVWFLWTLCERQRSCHSTPEYLWMCFLQNHRCAGTRACQKVVENLSLRWALQEKNSFFNSWVHFYRPSSHLMKITEGEWMSSTNS